ncbi:MAG: NADH-quinone oxidoreductase subunit NuoH [Planctomycetes bacterium]|jgi:NADH-quinone oxidoreductase subunit H|nr:NADH-quinone oxidoreductase subunit NuoH [Planctomycetota bacterium]
MNHGSIFLDLLVRFAPEGTPPWLLDLAAAGVGAGILVAMVAVIAMFCVWMERKVAGHIQCRYGPMYVGGWHGWAQSIADGVKLLLKEDMIPLGADRPLFVLAPALVLGSIFAALAALPLAPGVFFADIDLGLFFILAMSSMTTIGVVMAGWASASKWTVYGAMREAAQVVAYEIPLGVSLLVPLIVAGTFNLNEASIHQAGWYGMHWYIFQNPFVLPAFVLFFISALAETKRAPFDLPEAESELVAGFMTEYSGIRWSFFFMEEYAAMFLMSVVAAVFFLGGFESPFTSLARDIFGEQHFLASLVAGLVLLFKAFGGIFLMMWLRWTLPRVRIDQVMTMGYKYLTPLALVCVLGASLFEALWRGVA